MRIQTRQHMKIWSLFTGYKLNDKFEAGEQNVLKRTHLCAQIHKGMSNVLSKAKQDSRQNAVGSRAF